MKSSLVRRACQPHGRFDRDCYQLEEGTFHHRGLLRENGSIGQPIRATMRQAYEQWNPSPLF